jgi:hypothetical protein
VFKITTRVSVFLLILLPFSVYSRKRDVLPALKAYCKEQENVQVLVKPLTGKESKKQFGTNFIRRGYQPIQLVIENNNQSYFILHPWYIGLPIMSPERVAREAHTNAFWVSWSMIGIGAFIGIQWFAPLTALIFLAFPTEAWIRHTNKEITENTLNHAIDRTIESIVIPPFGTVTRYIFVAEKDFNPDFSLTVLNGKNNQPVQFNVILTTQSIISGV